MELCLINVFSFSIITTSSILSQQIKVNLTQLTGIDDQGIHMVTLSSEPEEKLILPNDFNKETPLTKKYLNLFYTWDSPNDQNISVLVYQFKNEDVLYIDKNNDNDLTNDGKPVLFPLSQDSISFEIYSSKDHNQKLRLALYRKPDVADSLIQNVIDSSGNISAKFLPIAKMFSDDFNYEGKKRTFYFDYRISLRKGKLKLGDSTYSVGLFDYTNNGRYDDQQDLFLIDLNNTGELNLNIPSTVFAINDIFKIKNKNYYLSTVDKYGRYFIINETDSGPTFHYLKWVQEETSKNQRKGKLSESFWGNSLVSLNNKKVELSSFKGKYLFIYIWGEWCMPCIYEIDELIQGYKKFKNKVNFLSIMKVGDLKKAKKIIRDKKIHWLNTFISDDIIKEFNVKGYPTNILIYPDGESYIKEYGINRIFFDMNIK